MAGRLRLGSEWRLVSGVGRSPQRRRGDWGGGVATNTYKSWLKQKKAERRLQVAEEAMAVVYKSADVFSGIRNPGSMNSEAEAATQRLTDAISDFAQKPEAVRHRYITAQVALDRVAASKEFWDEYWKLLPAIKMYFGDNFDGEFRKIWAARAKIVSGAHSYSRLNPELNPDLNDRIEGYFWEGWAEATNRPDEIGAALAELKTAAEETIFPLLRPDE